eukprot:SM000182S03953  [mRNA]  locus=s182:273291:273925:- [translate_table: standard]
MAAAAGLAPSFLRFTACLLLLLASEANAVGEHAPEPLSLAAVPSQVGHHPPSLGLPRHPGHEGMHPPGVGHHHYLNPWPRHPPGVGNHPLGVGHHVVNINAPPPRPPS